MIDCVTFRNRTLRISFTAIASATLTAIPKRILKQLMTSVFLVARRALLMLRKKNSKFFNPTNSLPNKPP